MPWTNGRGSKVTPVHGHLSESSQSLSSNQNGNAFEVVITARLVIERLKASKATGEALAGALFAGAGVPVGAR